MSDIDKRRAHRLKIELPAFFKITKTQPHISIGTTIDISATGICLKTREHLSAGQELTIQLKLPDGEKISLNAKVVWVKGMDYSMYSDQSVGIQLTGPIGDNEKKFVRYYAQQLIGYYNIT